MWKKLCRLVELIKTIPFAVKEVLDPANEREEVILSSDKSAEDFQLLIQNVMSSFAFTLENTAIEEHDSVSSICPSESLKLVSDKKEMQCQTLTTKSSDH